MAIEERIITCSVPVDRTDLVQYTGLLRLPQIGVVTPSQDQLSRIERWSAVGAVARGPGQQEEGLPQAAHARVHAPIKGGRSWIPSRSTTSRRKRSSRVSMPI